MFLLLTTPPPLRLFVTHPLIWHQRVMQVIYLLGHRLRCMYLSLSRIFSSVSFWFLKKWSKMSETEFLILLPCWEEVYWNCCHDLRKINLCIFLSLCSSYVWYESWQKLLRKKSMFPERKKLFPPLLSTRIKFWVPMQCLNSPK